MRPRTEFRIYPVSGDEPADRTTAGAAAGDGDVLDLGTLDTTDEAQDVPVVAVCWRVLDFDGGYEVRNLRVWLEGTDGLAGSAVWHMDISDEWTKGKTPVEVGGGTPGAAPLAEGAPNLTRIGGGTITGSTHDQTSQYIYLSGRVGVDVPTGAAEGVRLVVAYDAR